MDAVEITSIVTVIVTILTSLIVPWWLRRRGEKQKTEIADRASWEGLTSEYKRDNSELRRRLDSIDAEHQKRMRAMEEDYTRQLDAAKARIKALEDEVAALYIRLYSGQRPSSPRPDTPGWTRPPNG